MKIGKFIYLGIYKNIKIGYGTVDCKNLKTIYIKLNSWVEPIDYYEDYDNLHIKSRRKIKNLIYEYKNENFKPQSIVDLDIKTKGIKMNKKSFMDLDITLYVNNFFEIRDKLIKNQIKDLIESIVDKCLLEENLYIFHKTKK